MQGNQDWEHAYNFSPAYFFSFSYDGLILMMNDGMLKQLGFEADEVLQKKKFIDILTVGGKIFYQTHFFPLIKLHGEYQEVFLSVVSRSGEEIPILINVKMEGIAPEAIIHCGGVRITKRNKFEREILEAKKKAEKAEFENESLVKLQKEFEKNQIILEQRLQKSRRHTQEQQQINSIISHELQEPLRKIGIFSKLLLDETLLTLSDRNALFLKKINRSSENIRELMLAIQKYLSVSEKNMVPVEFSLETVFADAYENVKDLFKEINVRINKANLPEVYADKQMMYRVMCEILSNAAKFSDPQKEILNIDVEVDKVEENIFTEVEGRYRFEEFTRIVFKDNGIGFANKYQEEIFILFRKAHLVDEGLGFGLAYCKKVIDLHHGYFSAEGEVGLGAKFTILLPGRAFWNH